VKAQVEKHHSPPSPFHHFSETEKVHSHLTAASGGTGLHTLTLTHAHRRLVVDGSRAHTLLDLSRHGEESLLDVRGVLGRGLEERDA